MKQYSKQIIPQLKVKSIRHHHLKIKTFNSEIEKLLHKINK